MPLDFIASRSRVMDCLVTLPLIHHQYTRICASIGGLVQPVSKGMSASALKEQRQMRTITTNGDTIQKIPDGRRSMRACRLLIRAIILCSQGICHKPEGQHTQG